MKNDAIVSFDDENLILVDKDDNILGYEKKDACHVGDGITHRAFSAFIFNERKELLLQKRSAGKLLWPLFWSNSCCSHPRQGETLHYSVERRLQEELGFNVPVHFLFKFQYQAKFKDIGSENELCSVLIGKYTGEVLINKNEIAQWRYISIRELDKELEEAPDQFTPWFKIEWKRIKEKYINQIMEL